MGEALPHRRGGARGVGVSAADTDELAPIRASVRSLCEKFPGDFDVARKFGETRLYQVAPISTNMILSYLAEHVLGLPRSY